MGFTALVFAAILFSSCSKFPQTEIENADAAIEEAFNAGAKLYLPDNYIALKDSMKSAMEEIESEKSNFIKNFTSAKEKLTMVSALAQELTQQTETKKEEIKVEIQTLISDVTSLIETNKKLITEAPKGKEGTSALNAIKSELSEIETSVNDANALFTNGEFLLTHDKIKAAKEKATLINEELVSVISKYKSNSKR